MLPRRPRAARRRSTDSLHSLNGQQTIVTFDENGIPNADEFLDDHLPIEYFRQDVIRLIHSLRIPGWSRVSEDMALDMDMMRINGALTNSVYSVKAPSYIKEAVKREYAGKPYHHRLPPNLLLRVYGPQCDILVDRERELLTVAQLTKHNIGPKLFGTFVNGRFEQFLNAHTLTKEELRNPETSMLIAKRMQELHANIPVENPDAGYQDSCLWRNYGKWVTAAESSMKILNHNKPGTELEVLCGATFDEFKKTSARYQEYLATKYPNLKLYFCHNDTQYGNILRLDPPKGSPLLRPQNEHMQLVVIDFEYSGPNYRALDIANHFCEWMSDYHHHSMPHHIWEERYPTIEEQRRFVQSYVEHGSLDFNETVMETEIEELLKEINDFKPAVNMLWGLWGIIQTPAEKDQEIREEYLEKNPNYDITGSPEGVVDEEVDEFDNLAYAREKFAIFWKDVIKVLGS